MNVDELRLISFWKMSGSGNDFIIIDNRDLSLQIIDLPVFVRRVCQRKVSVGADGLFLIEPSAVADFKWRFFNSDGSLAEMCGNGSRCVARYAYLNGIAGRTMSFETLAGIITAEVNDDSVKVRLTDPSPLKIAQKITLDGREYALDCIDTGVPHAVLFVPDADKTMVSELGPQIRRHPHFGPRGTNVNFVQVLGPGRIRVRTFERGVEGETLACGTGVTASALVSAKIHGFRSPLSVQVQGGDQLHVSFEEGPDGFGKVKLGGPADFICEGTTDL